MKLRHDAAKWISIQNQYKLSVFIITTLHTFLRTFSTIVSTLSAKLKYIQRTYVFRMQCEMIPLKKYAFIYKQK